MRWRWQASETKPQSSKPLLFTTERGLGSAKQTSTRSTHMFSTQRQVSPLRAFCMGRCPQLLCWAPLICSLQDQGTLMDQCYTPNTPSSLSVTEYMWFSYSTHPPLRGYGISNSLKAKQHPYPMDAQDNSAPGEREQWQQIHIILQSLKLRRYILSCSSK